MKTKFTGDDYSFGGDLDLNVELFNPCENPVEMTAPAQTNPVNYLYTGANPGLIAELVPFTVEPSTCEQYIEYSCQVTQGSRLDLCSISDGDTAGVFDAATGRWQFTTVDVDNYLPGTYTIEVSGTVGQRTEVTTFEIVLEHPCPTTELTLQLSPFADSTFPDFTYPSLFVK